MKMGNIPFRRSRMCEEEKLGELSKNWGYKMCCLEEWCMTVCSLPLGGHTFMCDADQYSRYIFLHKKLGFFKNKKIRDSSLHHLVFRYRAFVPPPLVRDCGQLNTPDVPGPVWTMFIVVDLYGLRRPTRPRSEAYFWHIGPEMCSVSKRIWVNGGNVNGDTDMVWVGGAYHLGDDIMFMTLSGNDQIYFLGHRLPKTISRWWGPRVSNVCVQVRTGLTLRWIDRCVIYRVREEPINQQQPYR